MSTVLDQVTAYARENPGIVACACVTVLLMAITQIVLTAPAVGGGGGGGGSGGRALIFGGGSGNSVIGSVNHDGVVSTALSEAFAPYPLLEKREVSHNVRILRFGLKGAEDVLGLPTGRHLSIRAQVDGREVRRPYTPISMGDASGYFELLIKVYAAPHGTMSRHLDAMQVGDCIEARGPLGRFSYSRNAQRSLRMVCGGTGITPMWQVFTAVLNDPLDETRISLVFANVAERDILLRDELDELDATRDRFSVFYVLERPPPDWTGGVGYVSRDILDARFGPPEKDAMVLMCGPPPMNKAVKSLLQGMGYKDNQVFKF